MTGRAPTQERLLLLVGARAGGRVRTKRSAHGNGWCCGGGARVRGLCMQLELDFPPCPFVGEKSWVQLDTHTTHSHQHSPSTPTVACLASLASRASFPLHTPRPAVASSVPRQWLLAAESKSSTSRENPARRVRSALRQRR